MLYGLDGSDLASLEALVGFVQRLCCTFWCAAAPHIVACITACTRTRNSRPRRLQPLPLMVAARCTDMSVLASDLEATKRSQREYHCTYRQQAEHVAVHMP
jgi:hypothetical protein